MILLNLNPLDLIKGLIGKHKSIKKNSIDIIFKIVFIKISKLLNKC